MKHPTTDAPGTSTGRQLTLWSSTSAPSERKLRRPTWHRISPLSLDAARRAAPRAGTRQAQILDYVASRGQIGATREEISLALALAIQSVCSPCRALLDAQLLVETAETRPTSLGSPAAVLVASRVMEG